MKNKDYSSFLLFIVYLLLGFPMFYFVYKYGDPTFSTADFFDYYPVYKDFNMEGVKSPFNIRLVSPFFVYLLNKMNFHYDTQCTFDQFNLDRQVFFNAVFFNYLCIVSTCIFIFKTVNKFLQNGLLAFGSGLIYLLGFGTIFYEYMPITDAFSILVFTICFHLYLSRSSFILLPFLVLIFQREYIFLVFGLIALMDYFKYRAKYFVSVLIMCICCMAIYVVLRKTIFYTWAHANQFDPAEMVSYFFNLQFPIGPYVRQLIMTLNVLIIYILLVAYKRMTKYPVDAYNFWKIILLFLQVNFIAFAGGIGNNAGRIFYFSMPLIIFYLAAESLPLIRNHNDSEKSPVPAIN